MKVVQISVHGDPSKANLHPYGPKVKAALERWEAGGSAKWDVIYHIDGDTPFDVRATMEKVQPTVTNLENIHTPSGPLPQLMSKAEDEERWNEDVSTVFEWVGMAFLGSQRCAWHVSRGVHLLYVNGHRLRLGDRCDPYIAVYEPPSPSQTANLLHFRWTGFLSSAFVQQVVDMIGCV